MNASTPAPLVVMSAADLRELVRDAVAGALGERGASIQAPGALLSTPELAERLGCSRAKVHQLAQDPTAPVVWLGDSRRWSYDDVIAWLRARGRVANESKAKASDSRRQTPVPGSRKQPDSRSSGRVSQRSERRNHSEREEIQQFSAPVGRNGAAA